MKIASEHSFAALSRVRLFSSLKAKIPEELTERLDKSFADIDPRSTKINFNKITDGANKTVKWLQDKSLSGCQDSSVLLKVMNDFKDPKNVALYLSGAPTKTQAARYFSHVMASVIDRSLELTSGANINEKGGRIAQVLPHSDGSKLGVEVDLTILGGLVSDGRVRTYTLDINQLQGRLSEKSKAILAEPIFGYAKESPVYFADNRESLKSPILYRDGNNLLKINFSYDAKALLLCNYDNTRFSEVEVDEAVKELHKTVKNMYETNEVASFFIKEGDALILRNKLTLHGRDGSSESDRIISFCSYGPKTNPRNTDYSSLSDDELGKVAKR